MSSRISTNTKTIAVIIGWLVTAIPNLGLWFTAQSNTPSAAFRIICSAISLLALTTFVVSVIQDKILFSKNKQAIRALAAVVRESKRGGRSAEWGEHVQTLIDKLFTSDAELFKYESSSLYPLLVKLDKKRPGRDDLNVWSSPNWNDFNEAVLELLCIVERQIK